MHWKEYQKKVVDQAKEAGSLVLAGDGRHDSMGHCAYTIFSCTTSIIIHFSLVQVNKKFCRISKHFLARYILIM